MKPYQRVTCIGYNTGKVIIGLRHMPKPRPMGTHECAMQTALITPAKPRRRNPIIEKIVKYFTE